MKGSIAQVNRMQEKEKTELEINIVTESNSLFCKLQMKCKTPRFNGLQLSWHSFKFHFCISNWVCVPIKDKPRNFDSSFLFSFFKYINTATSEGFRKFSNILLHLLYPCALTNSFAYILMLLSSKKLFWKTLNLLNHCKTESLTVFINLWNYFFLCATHRSYCLSLSGRTKNNMQNDIDLIIGLLCICCTKQ